MKKSLCMILALTSAGVLPAAWAGDYDDMARVLSVSPRTEQVNQPRRECWTDTAPAPRREARDFGGAILGGLAGGLIGSQVGQGRGRIAGAAVGAAAGSMIGDRVQNNDAYADSRPVDRCRTVDHWETRTNGYFVTYDYQGHQYTDVMSYDPGDRIRVHVHVAPRP